MRAWFRTILGNRPYLYGTLAGVVMFAAIYVVNAIMVRLHLRPEVTFLDNFLLASLAAALIATLEIQHQHELRRQQQRIALIIEMNHHIRNALQSIVYVNSKMSEKDAAIIAEAIKRIEWALTEVLPGELPRTHEASSANSLTFRR